MLKDFKKIYEKELRNYEHSTSLETIILQSTYIRSFVYEVCKNCIIDKEEKRIAHEKNTCSICGGVGWNHNSNCKNRS